MPTDSSFIARLGIEGYLLAPHRYGFTDVQSEDWGHAVAWSPDGRSGIAFELRKHDAIAVYAVDKAGLPLG